MCMCVRETAHSNLLCYAWRSLVIPTTFLPVCLHCVDQKNVQNCFHYFQYMCIYAFHVFIVCLSAAHTDILHLIPWCVGYHGEVCDKYPFWCWQSRSHKAIQSKRWDANHSVLWSLSDAGWQTTVRLTKMKRTLKHKCSKYFSAVQKY